MNAPRDQCRAITVRPLLTAAELPTYLILASSQSLFRTRLLTFSWHVCMEHGLIPVTQTLQTRLPCLSDSDTSSHLDTLQMAVSYPIVTLPIPANTIQLMQLITQ
ncbi:hypothetical protein FPOAC1_003434 [Fusarium poae]|uniref:hypothetical protein n=1 Tax=Fusarium poae TaxID=36050 RepID=UPI001CE9AF36|nr:hypothetical protein FPOAC1_003434 [Fusarium poae]KAG8677417.1 hypothetical protein FPOAC1_003434 [Fusarium poae]